MVSFNGGAMGSFLINLLDKSSRVGFGQHSSNLEWNHVSYFLSLEHGILDTNESYHAVKKPFIDKFDHHQWTKYYLYAYAYSSYQVCKDANGSINEFVGEKFVNSFMSSNNRLDVKNNVIPTNDLDYFYVKSHPFVRGMIFFYDQSITWKQKIHCYFPDDKLWIMHLLALWKHHLFKLFHPSSQKQFIDFWLLDAFTNPKKHEFVLTTGKFKYLNLDDFTHVNMYNLIFNNDVSELYEKIPGFELTPDKEKILTQACQSNCSILDKFGFDHRDSFMKTITMDDLKNNIVLKEMINEYSAKYIQQK